MNLRLGALAALIAMLAFSSLAGTPCSLISPGADAREWSAPHTAETGRLDVSGEPVIEFVSPDLSRAVRNLVNVDMRFRAQPGRASISTRSG